MTKKKSFIGATIFDGFKRHLNAALIIKNSKVVEIIPEEKAAPKKPVTKKVSKAKKTTQKKVLKTKPKASVANNKSKIAPYKVKKNEKWNNYRQRYP